MQIYKRIMLVLWVALLGVAMAQENPVSVEIKAFIVNQVTDEDGKVSEDFVESSTARPGQVVEYRVTATNNDATSLPAENVKILGPIPNGTAYVDGSATPSSDEVRTEFSLDNESFSENPESSAGAAGYKAVRWTPLVELASGASVTFVYRVTIN